MDLALPTVSSVGDGLALTLLAVVAVPVTIIDVRCRRIPDVIVLPAVVAALVLRAVWGGSTWAMLLLWAMVAGAMLLGPAVIRPEGMGMGDAKLAVLLGARRRANSVGQGLRGWVWSKAGKRNTAS